MKKILLIICLFPILVFSQKSYKIPADSTILNNIGSGKNELVIRNATSNITGGILTNLGNGVTAFVLGGGSARVVDTIYKNNTKDSIVFTISGIRYAVKDSFNLNTDSQTLSISNDTLTISGGNSVILPVYVQADSSTIFSYDVLNSQNAPPGSPAIGDTYLVGNSPSGAWVGHAKDIAEWDGADWVFTDGVQGDFLYNATNALTYIFRSGNWVQTTGIPALNNGNTISSGLRIGTNNARSLTFETNNVNRGRFDSVGRFYVYDTSLRNSNKFLQIDSATGRLIASAISGTSGGTSTLFPNGIEFVNASRDFQSSDAGKRLMLSGTDISVTMPAINPFDIGDYVGIVSDGIDCAFNVENGGDLIYPLKTGDGSTSECVVLMNTEIEGDSWLFPISTSFKYDETDSLKKTALKYLYDKSQQTLTFSTSTTTFTNKRITARVDSTTSSATPTINTDNIDTYKLTAQAVDITSFTTNLTGTPTDDQILHIVIIGTASRAITWGSSFEASTVALPTTTVSTDRLDVYFIWNTATSKWRCGGVW